MAHVANTRDDVAHALGVLRGRHTNGSRSRVRLIGMWRSPALDYCDRYINDVISMESCGDSTANAMEHVEDVDPANH
eukprot:1627106-Amphidinium_carterae.1